MGELGRQPNGLKTDDGLELQAIDLKVDGEEGKLANDDEDAVEAEILVIVLEMSHNPLPQVSPAKVQNREIR